jgi:hypothetical protein
VCLGGPDPLTSTAHPDGSAIDAAYKDLASAELMLLKCPYNVNGT